MSGASNALSSSVDDGVLELSLELLEQLMILPSERPKGHLPPFLLLFLLLPLGMPLALFLFLLLVLLVIVLVGLPAPRIVFLVTFLGVLPLRNGLVLVCCPGGGSRHAAGRSPDELLVKSC